MWGELRADMIAVTQTADINQSDVVSVNTVSTNPITNWMLLYRTINYCNTVIDFAPAVINEDPTFNQAQLDAYLAEAYGLRSLMYFYLVRSFGDVPLKLKSTSSDSEIEQLPKNTKEEVLNQIVKDLEIAERGAVTTYGNRASDKGRFTKYTINALQADVYLWMEKYNECITACDKIINSGNFGLIAGNSAWFNTLYYNGNSNEGIFEFQFDQQILNPFYNMFIAGARDFVAQPRVMEEMYMIDFLNDQNKDIRGDGAAVRITDNAIWKLVAFDFNTARSAAESYAHWFVYRYADVLLMKAEALAYTNRGEEALAIVQTIRDRAHAIDATAENPDTTDPNAVGDYILAERAREFSFEGKRWYDILRFSKKNNYERISLLLNMVAKTVPGDRQQTAINIYKDFNSHYFPIYFYELQTNKTLVQNPFYQ